MGKGEINPLRGQRLERALEEAKIKKGEFAQNCYISSKHLSEIIHGKKGLTEANAKLFAEKLGVRFEWLLCFDDIMTQKELQESLLFDAGWDSTEKTDIIDKILFTEGYSIVPNRDMSRFEKDDTKEITSFDVSVYYENKKLCELTDFEHEALTDEIADFASYVMKKVIEKKGKANDGE